MTRPFTGRLEKIDDYRWRIPAKYMEGMRVPGLIFSDEKMLKSIVKDNAPQQIANAAHLPGIVRASMAMPDIHWGYGLPIGGVAATDIEAGGVITPGAVGFDVNCGVRLIRTDLTADVVRPHIKRLVDALFARVPTGVGSTGRIKVNFAEEKSILVKGAGWAVEKGYGWKEDLEHCEAGGAIAGADPSKVSERAYERGRRQPGTLGSGNHFLEVQVVDEVYRQDAAEAFGIRKGQITVMIHTGSRGFGHQVCTDYAARMVKLMSKFNISIPDRQLACVPVKSDEGKAYLGAMRCAANYAWVNRQAIMHLAREVFGEVFGESARSLGMALVYDVAHNIAKIERYDTDAGSRLLCVHRKGATRAFPPGHEDLPEDYKEAGQPVIIPGDMGRCSYLLAGTRTAEETFYSTCHGAGRLMSRTAAKKATRGRAIARELADRGIIVRYMGRETLHEEVSEAYKDVSDVVDIVQGAGLSDKIARMRPLGVIKG
ncbi:MAG: RNA-splicing ligase RtcB [Candidatus Makaraimicrobium thalassicum]|nr:MAG: RNA-splicing ligase RtcB [Candidatus Omnitrophota bacterium]